MKINNKEFVLAYPDYHTRAFTLSYDDGTIQDQRVMALCRKYGMGCTFAPNTAFLDGSHGTFNHLGYDVYVERCKAEDLKKTYEGFEIAGHTATHPNMRDISAEQIKTEAGDSKDYLSSLVGYEVRGMTYPNNGYDDRVIAELKKYNIVYGRTTDDTLGFEPPVDFMKWHATCHDHYAGAPELVDKCVADKSEGLKVYYAWGHAYEFDKPDSNTGNGQRWDDFIKLLEKVHDTHAFWCVSNIEIYDYITATRALEYTDSSVKNPTDKTIYAFVDGKKITIGAGETYNF